jgi:hypothetical protein
MRSSHHVKKREREGMEGGNKKAEETHEEGIVEIY